MRIAITKEENIKVVLAEVAGVMDSGGVAVVPTDTVYGLICDARNEAAVRRMFMIKKRPQEKALPIFVKDIAAARHYVYISDAKARFLEKVWPGQVTVVFQHKEKLPPVLTCGRDMLGVRIPGHPFLAELLWRLNFPLAQTSANISAQPPAKSREEVERYFAVTDERLDILVDGGVLPGASSTVIDFTGTAPIILRVGPISKSDLDVLLCPVED